MTLIWADFNFALKATEITYSHTRKVEVVVSDLLWENLQFLSPNRRSFEAMTICELNIKYKQYLQCFYNIEFIVKIYVIKINLFPIIWNINDFYFQKCVTLALLSNIWFDYWKLKGIEF
jgi:hypothetical protein